VAEPHLPASAPSSSPTPAGPADESARTVAPPFGLRHPILGGMVAGVLLRLAFSGQAGSPWSAMAGTFIFLAPVLVGMLTVYLAERQCRRSWGYYVAAPVIAVSSFVAGTLVMMIEGLICAFVILPLFAVLGALGGLLMGLICRLSRWPRPRHALYSLGVLPLGMAVSGMDLPLPPEFGTTQRSVHIQAPPAVVWDHLLNTPAIPEARMNQAWAMRIGVPAPRSSVMTATPQGPVRRSRWNKGVYFDEVIQDMEPLHLLRWTYRFHPDSFPPGALDDHVLIGGHYFDLLDTQVRLTPAQGGTDMQVQTRYRISTHFNVYAGWWARRLLGNFSEHMLQVYKARCEAAAGPDRPSAAATPARP
jgi:hypothetical protein